MLSTGRSWSRFTSLFFCLWSFLVGMPVKFIKKLLGGKETYDKSTDVDNPEKSDLNVRNRTTCSPGLFHRWRGYHVCSSHHDHKTKEEMEDCNKVREFELEQQKRLQEERQKLAEMDKILDFTEKRNQHLVRKNEILEELSNTDSVTVTRTKMLKDSSDDSTSDTRGRSGLDMRRPDDFRQVQEALETGQKDTSY